MYFVSVSRPCAPASASQAAASIGLCHNVWLGEGLEAHKRWRNWSFVCRSFSRGLRSTACPVIHRFGIGIFSYLLKFKLQIQTCNECFGVLHRHSKNRVSVHAFVLPLFQLPHQGLLAVYLEGHGSHISVPLLVIPLFEIAPAPC